MTRCTGQLFPRSPSQTWLTLNHSRLFRIVPKVDGRPAVKVESNGKNKQYVRVTTWMSNLELTLFYWVVCRTRLALT